MPKKTLTDLEVQFLRAHVVGDAEAAEQLMSQQLAVHGEADALEMLTWIAFRNAVRMYFAEIGQTWNRGEVVRFVSQVRAVFCSEHPDLIDVLATEEQICYALGGPEPTARDAIAMGVCRMVMLRVLVELMELDSGQITDLLDEARSAVSQHLAGAGHGQEPSDYVAGEGAVANYPMQLRHTTR